MTKVIVERDSLGNVFNHIGFERKFELNVVSFGAAVPLSVYQRFVACRVDFVQVRENFSKKKVVQLKCHETVGGSETHFSLLFDPVPSSLTSPMGLASSSDSIELRIVFNLNSTSVLSVLKSSLSFRSCSISLMMSTIS